ncbi:MAG: hypothetical protein IPJ26_13975 [Bacteroidetes bacterium]|nr:hypothetical protein [Bacteroidota bacterium]
MDDGANGDEYTSLLVKDTGFVYTIGRLIPAGQTRSDLLIAKYDDQGAEIWRTTYAGPAGRMKP